MAIKVPGFEGFEVVQGGLYRDLSGLKGYQDLQGCYCLKKKVWV